MSEDGEVPVEANKAYERSGRDVLLENLPELLAIGLAVSGQVNAVEAMGVMAVGRGLWASFEHRMNRDGRNSIARAGAYLAGVVTGDPKAAAIGMGIGGLGGVDVRGVVGGVGERGIGVAELIADAVGDTKEIAGRFGPRSIARGVVGVSRRVDEMLGKLRIDTKQVDIVGVRIGGGKERRLSLAVPTGISKAETRSMRVLEGVYEGAFGRLTKREELAELVDWMEKGGLGDDEIDRRVRQYCEWFKKAKAMDRTSKPEDIKWKLDGALVSLANDEYLMDMDSQEMGRGLALGPVNAMRIVGEVLSEKVDDKDRENGSKKFDSLLETAIRRGKTEWIKRHVNESKSGMDGVGDFVEKSFARLVNKGDRGSIGDFVDWVDEKMEYLENLKNEHGLGAVEYALRSQGAADLTDELLDNRVRGFKNMLEEQRSSRGRN